MNYDQMSSMLSKDDESKLFRKDSDHNVDHLIVKPTVVTYINKNQVELAERDGLYTPSKLLEKYPNHKDKIINVYKEYLDHDILKHCIFSYLCRIPHNLNTTYNYVKNNCPVKINIDRYQKKLGSTPIKMYLIKHPSMDNKLVPITKEKLYE